MVAYLGFDGNCAEAMRFYERVLGLGARLEVLVSGADTPMAEQMPAEHRHRIMHARLAFEDGSWLFAGDAPANRAWEGIKGITMTLNYPTTAEAERVFKSLADGGSVGMPIQPTFWAKVCGMVNDRYGTPWIINGELLPVYAKT
ncbi:MAG: VOC family protein [Steroidobacteraceae bacterium]